MKIIRPKMKGKKAKLPEREEAPDSGVLDLMSKLRASLEQGSGKKTAAKSKRASTAKKARTAKRKTA
jgi:non-homologous end joining protein Ku